MGDGALSRASSGGLRRHASSGGLQRHAPAARMATLTAAWVAPLVAFVARNFERPPTGASFVVFVALGAAAALIMFAAPDRLFRLYAWERGGTLYRPLGVRRFRRIAAGPGTRIQRLSDPAMPSGARRHAAPDSRSGRALDFGAWPGRGLESERAHWCFLLAGAAIAVWAWRIGRPGFTLYLVVATVPFNVYPILLQRYTRGRFARIARRRRSGPRPNDARDA